MKILLQKHPHGHRNLLEWSPDGRRWYPINERHVIPQRNGDPDPFKALEPFRRAINKVYKGAVEVFEGCYNREEKTLTLKA
jgi:hypothetical protein